jgi:hypothetical protein
MPVSSTCIFLKWIFGRIYQFCLFFSRIDRIYILLYISSGAIWRIERDKRGCIPISLIPSHSIFILEDENWTEDAFLLEAWFMMSQLLSKITSFQIGQILKLRNWMTPFFYFVQKIENVTITHPKFCFYMLAKVYWHFY